MPGPDVHEGLTPEGNEIEKLARENAQWLKVNLNPDLLEKVKASIEISSDDEMLLNSCMDPENYLAIDDRGHVDELIAKLREIVEAA